MPIFVPSVLSFSDYYPFGMLMPGRHARSSFYRYGFNGKENDKEIKGNGNSVDFGARMYDSRIGRWFSTDALFKKHPDLSPYHFTGNNPIIFVDNDGNDFGVRINYKKKTIVIVANIYTISMKTYKQALAAAKAWNEKTANIGKMKVSFQINVIKPKPISDEEAASVTIRKNGKIINSLAEKKLFMATTHAKNMTTKDIIGNLYVGNESDKSQLVKGEKFIGGVTNLGEMTWMNSHKKYGDMGESPDLVSHEIGHLLGLDDKKEGTYYADGGIMDYEGAQKNEKGGFNLFSISNEDVQMIINYARDKVSGINVEGSANVTIINEDKITPIGTRIVNPVPLKSIEPDTRIK